MRYCLGALAFLLPVAFLPGWSFYYDVTPKALVLLAGAAMLCVWACFDHATPVSIWTRPASRWNATLAGGFALTILISALSSPVAPLAWQGSNWRRWGAWMQIAAILVTLLASAAAARSAKNRFTLLRGLCAAGVLAALYGIAQYFGWDPFLDASAYHFGEGQYQIVRPPGPMGHSNYLAAFLLWPVFAGVALWRSDELLWGRALGAAAIATGLLAIPLCGSRGALVGLAVGGLLLFAVERPSLRRVGAGLALAGVVAGAFYVSPVGERMRARVFWIGEDSAGGSRLLLWRDSLRMAAEKPITGFGPDTFPVEFPRFQSAELSRAYPDFYHESPHNMFLDALVSQGVLGEILLAIWIAFAFIAGRKAFAGASRPIASALLAGLAASVAAHQFAVLVIPTGFVLFLALGLLTGLDAPAESRRPISRLWIAVPCAAAAILFGWLAVRLGTADAGLARVQRLLNSGATSAAADEWRTAQAWNGSGAIADLYFSQRWALESSKAVTAWDKLRYAQLAANAAIAATQAPEQRQNAWYNLAMLQAASNDSAGVERSLRAAIQAAPTWFKPHWTLARLLFATGRRSDAVVEAKLALDLNGQRDAEVIATMQQILRSAESRP
ncbi:MAG: O-antigen ligase family protein [Acidobacteriota bacterium]